MFASTAGFCDRILLAAKSWTMITGKVDSGCEDEATEYLEREKMLYGTADAVSGSVARVFRCELPRGGETRGARLGGEPGKLKVKGRASQA